MTEGYYRRKRHGNEFMSDEDDEGGKTRKFNKKQRRQRRLDREDGLYKIGMWAEGPTQVVARTDYSRRRREQVFGSLRGWTRVRC